VLPRAVGAEVPADLAGIDGEPVRSIDAGSLAAWVSDVNAMASISIDGVRAHDSVVEAALETGATPVPARYGQRFDNDDACRAALAIRATPIEALLANVAGQVEMTLILTPSTKRMVRDLEPLLPEMLEENTPGPGRQYLETLRAREAKTNTIRRAMDGLAARIAEASTRFVRRQAMHEQMTQLPLRTMSHLISREVVEQYKEVVGAVRTGTEFRFIMIGPRAPYSFCALGAGGGPHGMKLAD
jgi:hypothetical protein